MYIKLQFLVYSNWLFIIIPSLVTRWWIQLTPVMSRRLKHSAGSSEAGKQLSSSIHLKTGNLNKIRSKCWEARSKWRDIGLELNLANSDLEAIQEKYKPDVDKCFTEMLDLWLRTNPKPMLADLIAALREETVGFHHLAEELGLIQLETAQTVPTNYKKVIGYSQLITTTIFAVLVLSIVVILVGIQLPSAPVSPKNCFALGRGLEHAEIGEIADAVLYAIDQNGNPFAKVMETVRCEVQTSLGHKLNCKVKKHSGNQYKISYRPTHPGKHQLHIKVEGEHIRGSPFTVTVEENYIFFSMFHRSRFVSTD